MDQGAATIPGGVGIDADLPELSDPEGAWRDLLRAGRDCVVVFGGFAVLATVAIAFWFAPIAALAAAATMLALEHVLGRQHATRWRGLIDPSAYDATLVRQQQRQAAED
jgi:hypothetical protein